MNLIMGVDEVGRGCWAGPLVAAAVILDKPITGLKDSKLLSINQREVLSGLIKTQSRAYALGWVSSSEVDKLGLTKAVGLAMERASSQIDPSAYDEVIVDGNINYLPNLTTSRALVKADMTVPEVSAASIIAKVARDNYMYELAKKMPQYGFEKHVGYGTKQHLLALKNFGITKEHRLTYKPIRAML